MDHDPPALLELLHLVEVRALDIVLRPFQRSVPKSVFTSFFFSHAAIVLSSRLFVAVTTVSSTCQAAYMIADCRSTAG